MENKFTDKIVGILKRNFGKCADSVFLKSELLQYLNKKTAAANKGSKSRGSFANLYAIYVLVKDYVANGFLNGGKSYGNYEGAVFSKLMERQRELPFGAKLQNHALNNRVNGEFEKYFPENDSLPIVRNIATQRYWINEKLLVVDAGGKSCNIANAVIEIIDEYVAEKQSSFKNFISQCKTIRSIPNGAAGLTADFLMGLITPEMDARLFEIVSFSILKRVYADTTVYWGFSKTDLNSESLKLYKTGRTNANDGGIDFVMKPLGRFFQATETLDFKKYFLDIDKLEHYPVTFVVKTNDDIETIKSKVRQNALKTYGIGQVVDNYMNCIEEIINLPMLSEMLKRMSPQAIGDVVEEIIYQSKVEFNQ